MSGSEGKCLVAWVPVGEMRHLFSQEMAKQEPTPGGRGGGRRHPQGPQQQRQRSSKSSSGRHSGGQRGQQRRASGSPNDLVPRWKGFQLVGDSLMSRVAQRVSGARPTFNPKLRAKQIGLIVHGQTVGQLLKLMKEDRCPKLGNKVLLTIGTNNILKNVPVNVTFDSLNKILSRINVHGHKVLLTTVPPMPLIAEQEDKMQSWNQLNGLIKSIESSSSLTIVDLVPQFMSGESINLNLFESDKLHFNREGVEAFTAAVENAMKH